MNEPHVSDNVFSFSREPATLTIGRDASCDIRIKGVGVSRVHAVVRMDGGEITLEDNGDTSGILIGGNPVHRTHLVSGTEFIIGVHRIKVTVTESTITFSRIDSAPDQSETAPPALPDAITIGRDPANQLHLVHPLVSRFHATVRKTAQNTLFIEDHHSTNGTFVNGKPVRRTILIDGDIVHIGPYRFFCVDGNFHQARDFNRISVEARNVSVFKSGRALLDNVSLAIEPGKFIAVLGPSGAGKSTLAHTLMGLIPAREGTILFNGLPLKTFSAAFSSAIGFVSQGNILRPELTVYETFHEQCRLRLPKDSIAAEFHERIREVMALLDLTALSKSRVGRLSGGEAKRVHFGVELLSSPTIIFFDEPFAGLDPGLVHKFMALFRDICNKGHTLLLTTHTLEQIGLCDRIVFMNKGRIVFNGPPSDILDKNGAQSLSQLYEKQQVQQESLPPDPDVSLEAVAEEQKHYPQSRLYKPKRISLVLQLRLFIPRYFSIFFRDVRNVLLVLLQAPLIAVVLRCTFSGQTDYFPVSFYFCLTIATVWMGGMNSIREIAREWPIIEREFRVGVSQVVYVTSKIFVFGCIAVVQAMVFNWCLGALFSEFSPTYITALLLSAGCFSGTVLGLCVSVFSKNVNIAISWLPIIFIPQIFFSGILMPFDEMPVAGQVLSHATITRPIFSLFKTHFILHQSALQYSEWNALIRLCAVLIIFMILGVKFRRSSAQ